MARLPYVEDPTPRRGCRPAPAGWAAAAPAEADVAAAFDELRRLGRPPLNLYRILANQPSALRAFLGMLRYIRDDSTLPAPLRELTILATAHALGVRYEQVHHMDIARRAGVPDAKLAAFPAWQGSAAFDAAERAAMTYAHEIATTRRASDGAFEALRAHFSPAQIVELTLTVGWYHLVGCVLVPLEVDVEA